MAKQTQLYCAVVVRRDGKAHRDDQSFQCWVNADKNIAITHAAEKCVEWGLTTYTIKVGTLTQTADIAEEDGLRVRFNGWAGRGRKR